MSITVVVGAQFGSEGKGKATSIYARDYGATCAVVRCGGPNSGHVVVEQAREHCFRLIPAGLVYRRKGFLAPAAVVDLEVLKRELAIHAVAPELFVLDSSSIVIEAKHRRAEGRLCSTIASTGSGTGAATAAKVMRRKDARFVRDVLSENQWLRPYVGDVKQEMNVMLDTGKRIIVEGAQGFGLSLHHSGNYPHTTSKDTTAAQFIMEAGLSPLLVDEIVMVVRTFPIRVAGKQSGELPNEISWEQLRGESGYPHELGELTTVTRKLRRVARFDPAIVLAACRVNRPTKLVVHGLDYLDYTNHGLTDFAKLTDSAKVFIEMLQTLTGVPVAYAFTGRDNSAVVRMAGIRNGIARPPLWANSLHAA